MKTGKTLQELAAELERQKTTKRDFLSPAGQLEMMQVDGKYTLNVGVKGFFYVSRLGHEQIAGRLGIPQKYYDRMMTEAPDMLRANVNGWLGKDKDKKLVRTLDGNVRAFLSSRYRPLDNHDLAEAVLPILAERESGITVESCEITERRLYIKAVTERISTEIRVGDRVQAGIVISNSEVGCGSVKIEPLIFRLVCKNGMIVPDSSLKKYHVGRSGDAGDMAEEFFRDETRKADDRAFWLKVQDVVRGTFNAVMFRKMTERLREAAGQEITTDPVKAVEVVAERFGLAEDTERAGVLRWLIKNGDLTQYGLVNAVTRTAQELPDYDRSTELERIGGKVLELSRSDWQEIAA